MGEGWIDCNEEPVPYDHRLVAEVFSQRGGRSPIPTDLNNSYVEDLVYTLLTEATHWKKREPVCVELPSKLKANSKHGRKQRKV